MVEKSEERLLPTNKVRTIMKSCGDPSAFLSKESVLVVTKAAELFISYLTQQTHKRYANKKDLNYNDLSSFVQEEDKLEFLHQIVPKKITVKEFREILERGSEESESSDSEGGATSDEENTDEEIEEEEDDDDDDDDDDDADDDEDDPNDDDDDDDGDDEEDIEEGENESESDNEMNKVVEQ